MSDRIAASLRQLFEENRIVFWYDADRDMRAEFDAVSLPGVTKLEYATPDESVAAVRNGEADAVFADKDYLVPIAGDSGGALVMLDADVALGGGIGIGLRKSDGELKAKFDTAIQSMKADGTLNTLIEQHFGPDADKF